MQLAAWRGAYSHVINFAINALAALFAPLHNDTIDSDAGAIRTLIGIDDTGAPTQYGTQRVDAIDRWQDAGYQAVDDDSLVPSWLATGKTIESSIAAIDGYSDGATLDSVVHLTINQTADDIKKNVNDATKTGLAFIWNALPIWGKAGVIIAPVAVGYLYLRPFIPK